MAPLPPLPPLARVRIDEAALDRLADRYAREELPLPDWRAPELPSFGNRVADFQFLLLVNAINFCFLETDERPRYADAETGVEGAFGMFAALARLYPSLLGSDGTLAPDKLLNLSFRRFGAALAPAPGRGPMPLLEERLGLLAEVASGADLFPFERDAFTRREFLDLLTDRFPGYDDRFTYRGVEVEAAKRAQLLLAMLHGRGIVACLDPETVDLFADYRVPQTLREAGAILYPDDLIDRLARREFLREGEEDEREIRVATLACGRMLRDRLRMRGRPAGCMEIDFKLWCEARTLSDPLPFHRTLSQKY